jgi:serine/threonine protein kinase
MSNLLKLIGSEINNYIITRYINSGSFGDVFEARNKKTNELVALKIPKKTEDRDGQRSILEESKIYKEIQNRDRGVAQMKLIKHENKRIIAMDLLGLSLDNIMDKHKKIGLKTIILLTIQMIDILKYIHSCGYLHRDLKPDNFVLDKNNLKKLYCIDFGIAKRYLLKDGSHIKFSNTRRFCGTARYASIAAHSSEEQGRKDDLESLGYILVYLFKGKLPWQGIKHKDKQQRYKLIGNKKKEMKEEDICSGMPKEFSIYLKYVRNLDFDEKPPYSAFKKMFLKLYESKNYKTNDMEWE